MWAHNPWSNLFSLQRRMNRLFDASHGEEGERSVGIWSPRVEIVELDDRFEVTAELPGMKRDEVKVELKDDVLTISGEKVLENEKKDRNIHLCERVYGSFNRSFQMPQYVDASKTKAEFKEGVLTLDIPKVEEAKPKQISIDIK